MQEKRKGEFLKRKIVAEHGPEALPSRPIRSLEAVREEEETAVHDVQEDDIVVEESIDNFKDYYNKVSFFLS